MSRTEKKMLAVLEVVTMCKKINATLVSDMFLAMFGEELGHEEAAEAIVGCIDDGLIA